MTTTTVELPHADEITVSAEPGGTISVDVLGEDWVHLYDIPPVAALRIARAFRDAAETAIA